MTNARQETSIETSIFEGLFLLQKALTPDQLLLFAKAVGIHRYRLVKIIEKEETAVMSTLLRIAIFLDFCGIPVPFGVVAKEEVSMELLQLFAVSGKGLEFFVDTATVRESFLLHVRGVRFLPDRHREELKLIVDTVPDSVRNMIKKKKDSLFELRGVVERYLQDSLAVQQPEPETVSVTNTEVPEKSVTQEEARKRAERFASLVSNLTDFAQFYCDASTTEEDRRFLREVAGQKSIFDLKNLLARLCSERAYRELN